MGAVGFNEDCVDVVQFHIIVVFEVDDFGNWRSVRSSLCYVLFKKKFVLQFAIDLDTASFISLSFN